MVNIAADVWSHADSTPDKIALRSFTQEMTFAQLRDVGARVAGAVREAGIRPGDRVLFLAPTIPMFPQVYYGLHAAGAVVITMNTMSTKAEIDYVLTDSEVSLIVAWHQCAGAAQQSGAHLDIPVWVVDDTTTFDAEPVTAPHEHEPDDTCLILYT